MSAKKFYYTYRGDSYGPFKSISDAREDYKRLTGLKSPTIPMYIDNNGIVGSIGVSVYD